MLKKYLYIFIITLLACNNNQEPFQTKLPEQLPYYNSSDFTPIWNKVNHTISDFLFINQYSDTISKKQLTGKITIANFFFTTCPGICPKLTSNFYRLQDSLTDNKNTILLSHSVTPEQDTPTRLAKYARIKNVKSKWHLLTSPSKEEMYSHLKKSYLIGNNKGFTKTSTDFIHTEKVVLIDPNFKIRGVYNGTIALELNRILDDIKMLESEFKLI